DVAFALLDGLEDQRFFLRAHAFDGANPSVERGLLEIIERLDAELAIEHRHGLGTDTLQPHHVEPRGREFREQLAMELRIAGGGNFADLSRQVLANAGYVAQ